MTDSAIRRFKKQCEKAGILAELRKREHYEKRACDGRRRPLLRGSVPSDGPAPRDRSAPRERHVTLEVKVAPSTSSTSCGEPAML
jgi:hypothetical protein